jgi:general secretion pathway protein M
MIEKLDPTQRRLLALAILVLAVAAVFSATVWPVLLANQHYQNTIEHMESRLHQLQRAAAIGEALKPQYETLKRWQASDAQDLKSASPALAAAELQRLLKRIVAEKDVQVVSAQSLTTRQEAGFDRIALKVRMRGELENIVQTFYEIETGEPFVFLDNVSIRGSRGRRVGGKVSTLQVLDIDMEVIGYMPHSS